LYVKFKFNFEFKL